MVAVLSFAVFVTIDPDNNVLTPQVTFVALALFNILRFPLAIFAMIFSQRLRAFFAEEEINYYPISNEHSDEAVKIENCIFTWGSNIQEQPTLRHITMSVKRGQLVAIVGKVGAGKSSLLQAILGEMNKVCGNVNISGTIAYVPQQAWIQNLTLRDNILFNRTYDRIFYDKVVDACALRLDLTCLPAEDLTEIGEKGINLSGGQKQRVSLARAVYSNADIILLDDPLSAVDSHVGKHIFDNVICKLLCYIVFFSIFLYRISHITLSASTTGILSHTTRILVTHGLHYLKYCDNIIVIKDGQISEMGTYHELITTQGAFSEFLEEFLIEETKKRVRSGSIDKDDEDVSEILNEIVKFSPQRRKLIESKIIHDVANTSTIREKSSSSQLDITTTKRNGDLVTTQLEGENIVTTGRMEERVALLDEQNKTTQKHKLIENEGVETGKVS
ncbi:ABC transporter, ATP-binding protein [Dictyocaulus viviparus]|uniref:ABC transporter, ATP-binding protein n=1 Tax=Dictyocaulus viviparus TaxID=29172 RepID=A0A0D8X960_DICVI|nr:ABC transporter, ATP-binding protein [Dictyocaulus viviparus]